MACIYNTAQSIKKHITKNISKKQSIVKYFCHVSFVRLNHCTVSYGKTNSSKNRKWLCWFSHRIERDISTYLKQPDHTWQDTKHLNFLGGSGRCSKKCPFKGHNSIAGYTEIISPNKRRSRNRRSGGGYAGFDHATILASDLFIETVPN